MVSEVSAMMRIPRIVCSLSLACLLAVPICQVALADDSAPASAAPAAPASGDNGTPAPMPGSATPSDTAAPASPADNAAAPAGIDNTAPPAAPAPDTGIPAPESATAAPANQPAPSLVDLVDTFWHYGKIARYDLAADAGQKVLDSGASDADIVKAFETVAGKKGDAIDVWMLRFRSVPIGPDVDQASVQKLRDVANKLNDKINEGFATRRNDPVYVKNTIIEMSTGSRAYDNNLPRLARSAEVAVKVALDILRNPDERQYNNTCRRVLRDLGRKGLNPLLAATEMKDYAVLVDVIAALGDMGYEVSVPYLSRLMVAGDVPDEIHTAAHNALVRLNVADNGSPADQFYVLAQRFYYGKSDLAPSSDKISYMWYWKQNMGLMRAPVPTPIFNDCMAMRAAETVLRLDSGFGQAVSLWLAANTKREVDLPKGETDLTHKGDPDANYYNTSAGTQYLNQALARALRDRDAGVAYKLCQSLQNIVGQNAVVAGGPLTEALYFPNRQVRYEAAFALAQALPTRSFSGSDRVVPLLVEAINQSSKPGVVVVAPSSGATSASDIRSAVQSLGYSVVSGETPGDAAQASISLPTVDLIIISEDSDVRRMVDLERTIAHLQGSPMLVLTRTPDSEYTVMSATDSLMNAAVMPNKASMADDLKADIETARQHSGTAVMSDQEATTYALQAAAVLQKVALTRGQAFDLTVAEGGLLTALGDKRVVIAQAAGRVLSTINTASAQNGLAMKANDDATPAVVRVGLYESLADNAKHFGNHLDSAQISGLESVVSTNKTADVRDAAAEARGALDLPADQARTLILKQSRN
jgi:hypothetical protein